MFSGVIGNKVLVNFSIDPYLDINYVYLDTKEMRNFAQTEHKYLIEQVRQSSFKGIIGKPNFRFTNTSSYKFNGNRL